MEQGPYRTSAKTKQGDEITQLFQDIGGRIQSVHWKREAVILQAIEIHEWIAKCYEASSKFGYSKSRDFEISINLDDEEPGTGQVIFLFNPGRWSMPIAKRLDSRGFELLNEFLEQAPDWVFEYFNIRWVLKSIQQQLKTIEASYDKYAEINGLAKVK